MSKLLSEVECTSSQERAAPGNDDLQCFDGPEEPPHVSLSPDTTTLAELGGIDIECLDASLLQALSCLFPKDRGQSFVASLLRAAVIKQVDLPEVGCVDVAVVILKSIEAFARQHGHGKDTALRYVDILEALQMVRRHRHADRTELLLPLVAWAPSEQALSALDALLVESAARAKLQQLAGTVRDRFLLLYGSPHSWPSLFDDLHETLTDVQELLDRHLSPTRRSLLKVRIANLKVRLETEGEQGDLWDAQMEGLYAEDAEKGDFQSISRRRNIPGVTQKGDFSNGSEGSQVPHVTQKGDFSASLGTAGTSAWIQKGDFQDTAAGQNSHGSAEKGDFQAKSTSIANQKGDFRSDGSQPSLNDNGMYFSEDSEKKDVIVNDTAPSALPSLEDRYTKQEAATVGLQLALFLEQTPEHVGGFVNKCKACTRTIVRAAVIDALVHTHFPTVDPADVRGRPQSRAAWFHAACNQYMKPDASIPTFVRRWLKTGLSWEEIEEALRSAAARYTRYMIADGRTAELVRWWLRGELTDQALDEALQGEAVRVLDAEDRGQTNDESPSRPTRNKFLHLPRPSGEQQAKDWMDEVEAEELARHILQEAGSLGVTGAVAKQEPGRGVYLVELMWDGYRIPMRSPQAWEKHLAGVLRSRELQQQYMRERVERGGKYGTTQ